MSQGVFPMARAARAKSFVKARKPTLLHCSVLELLAYHPELSRQEIADLLGRGVQCVCPPVLQLLESGQIVETGAFRRTRFGGAASLVGIGRKKQNRKRGAK